MSKPTPVRPIKPWENLSIEQQNVEMERVRKGILEARDRIEAQEIAKRPKQDQVCRGCNEEIPHGSEFVAISKFVTRGHVANPQFIGKQPVSYGVEVQSVGALCLACACPSLRESP